jgi:flagellar assembly protein FliH
MTTSTERQVLRGVIATALPAARLDTDLRTHHGSARGRADARFADPTLERAFQEAAAEAREAARAEGYAVGWAEGRRAATEQVRVTARESDRNRQAGIDAQTLAVRTALRAIDHAAHSLEERAVTPACELREAVLHAAVELTETLLGRELAIAAEPGMDAVRRALDLLPTGRPVTMRLNPVDAGVVREVLAAMPAGELGREVLVVADASVEPAGCVAECDAMRVDAQLSTALDRVRKLISS